MSDRITIKGKRKISIRIKTPYEEYTTGNKKEEPEEEVKPEPVPEVLAIPEIDIEAELNEAYQKGYEEGRQSVGNELEEQYQQSLSSEINKFLNILSEFDNKIHEYDDIFEKLTIEMAYVIAEKVVEKEIEKNPGVDEILRKSLKKIVGANSIIIKLHPEDYESLSTETKKYLSSDAFTNVKFEQDPNMQRGGCFVETEIGNVDGRLNTRISELKRIIQDQYSIMEENEHP